MSNPSDRSDAAERRTSAVVVRAAANAAAPRGGGGTPASEGGGAAKPSGLRFQRVKDYVLGGIREGRYAVDDPIPSETALAEQFGVSRMTVNRALKELADAGYLYRIAGSGTYVADSGGRGGTIALRDIAEELSARGYRHYTYPLRRETVAAPPQIAARFNAAPGSRLHYARILHFRDDLPVAVEDRYVNPDLAADYPDLDLARETTHRYLLRIAPLQETEQVIRAVSADDDIRELLGSGVDEPCLLLRSRVFKDDRVLSVAELFYAASRYEIVGRSAAA